MKQRWIYFLRRKQEAVADRLRTLKTYFPTDITVVGAYNTLNAGDRILCDAVAGFYKEKGYKVQIQSKRKVEKIKSPIIIVCGGDIFHDANQNGWRFLVKLSKLSSAIYFLGAGVPGFYLKDKPEVSQLLSKFMAITTRDRKSFVRLSALKKEAVFKSVDNAFLMADQLTFKNEIETGTTVINIKAFHTASLNPKWKANKGTVKNTTTLKTYLAFWKDVIHFYKRNNCYLCSLSMTLEDEQFVRQHFSAEFDEIVSFTLDYCALTKRISRAETVFSSRYHFFILSLLNQKTIRCFAYADKVKHLCADLGIEHFITTAKLNNAESFLNNPKSLITPEVYSEKLNAFKSNHWLHQNTFDFE